MLGVGINVWPRGNASAATLDFNFLSGTSLDPRIAFTRASTAMRWNEQGVLENVAVNQPRFDYDPATRVTNIVTQSEFGDGFASTPVRGGLIALSTMQGFAGAVAFEAATSTAGYAYKGLAAENTLYTFSCIVEMNDDIGAPSVGTQTSTSDLGIMIAGGAPGSTVVTPLGGRRYRVSGNRFSGTTNLGNSGVVKWVGNSARTFKATAYQLELGAVLGAYVPTTTASASRAELKGLLMEESRTNLVWPSVFGGSDPMYYNITDDAVSVVPGKVARRYVHLGVGTPPAGQSGGTITSTDFVCQSAIVELDPTSVASTQSRMIFYRTAAPATMKCGLLINMTTGAVSVEAGYASPAGFGSRKIMDIGPNGGPVWLFWVVTDNPTAEALIAYPYPCASRTGAKVISHHYQLEVGRFPSSVIPTSTAQVTRAFEAWELPRSTWFNPGAFTLVADVAPGTVMPLTTSSTGPFYAWLALSRNPVLGGGTIGISGGAAEVPGRAGWLIIPATGDGGAAGRAYGNPGDAVLGGRSAVACDGAIVRGASRGVATTDTAATMANALNNVVALYCRGQLNGWLRSVKLFPQMTSLPEIQRLTS